MFLRAYLFVFDFGYFELSQFTSFRIRVMEMGKRDDFHPFSSVVHQNRPIWFSIDVCLIHSVSSFAMSAKNC